MAPLLITYAFGCASCLRPPLELLEIIMRRYERTTTLVTSNRPVGDWGKLLDDAAATSAMLDRLLQHGDVIKCGPRSCRTKAGLPEKEPTG